MPAKKRSHHSTHPNPKYTPELVDKIKGLREYGCTWDAIAQRLGVSAASAQGAIRDRKKSVMITSAS